MYPKTTKSKNNVNFFLFVLSLETMTVGLLRGAILGFTVGTVGWLHVYVCNIFAIKNTVVTHLGNSGT